MHADLKGALRAINTSWEAFEHNGRPMTKEQVKKVLEYGISKGYETTKDFNENEIDEFLTTPKNIMKQLELNLQKRLLIVGYQDDGCLIEDFNHYTDGNTALSPNLKKIKAKLICKGSELTEEIAKRLIPNELGFLFDGDNKEYSAFPDYKNINHPFEDKSFRTALESFISAIEANGYYWGENPIPFIEYEIFVLSDEKYNEYMKNHYEVESRTFNPEKTLIFEIIT